MNGRQESRRSRLNLEGTCADRGLTSVGWGLSQKRTGNLKASRGCQVDRMNCAQRLSATLTEVFRDFPQV